MKVIVRKLFLSQYILNAIIFYNFTFSCLIITFSTETRSFYENKYRFYKKMFAFTVLV